MGPSLRRRQVLGGVAAVVSATLAGCGWHGPSLEMREATDSDLLSGTVRSIPSGATSDRFRPIVETIENGTADFHSRFPRPVVEPAQPVVAPLVGPPIEYEGTYYKLLLTKTVERTLTAVEVLIGSAETSSNDSANAVEYDGLPAVDGANLADELPTETGERDNVSVHILYDEREANASMLVSEPDYDAIVRNGRRYSIDVTGVTDRRGYTYHYEADRVASTDDEFLRWLRDRYRYELRGLSETERDVVDEAIAEHRYAGSESDDAFVSLCERLLSEPAIDREDGYGEWVVRYDGSEYVAELNAPPSFH
ncbi:hypothetical protein [Halosolutus gelatinilyticus]|uniref:hypothetical protein n=1 Tax=Halosolutus gelatinilyticus TaxID=2931975 RepID=UPI001FF5CF03|nr:hypothetical protein [Halosolutus gelatinilyticus]